MASNLGTVFVELSLDDKVYKQKLSDTLTSVTATTKGIETSWKALGVKSDAVFEAQARAAKNAYELIKNSASATANDIIRAEEAKNAKLSQINKQQFGEQVSTIDKLKGHWIAATAAIAAAMGTISTAIEYKKMGAHALQAEESFRLVASGVDEDADKIVEAMKRASAGTVDDSDIMQKAVKGMVLGLSGDQLTKIMETARISARFTGEDVKTAYENITDAIATGLPKALKRYGLISKEEMAAANAAMKAGVENVDLYKIAMMNAEIQAAKFGEVHDSEAEKIQRFSAQINELKERIGIGLIDAINATVDAFQGGWAAAFSAAEGNTWDLIDAIDKSNKKTAEQIAAERQAAKEKIEAAEAAKKAEMARIKAATDAKKNAYKIEKDILASETKENQEYYETATSSADHWLKMQKLYGTNELNYAVAIIDKKTAALNEWYDKQAATINKHVSRESEKQAKLSALDVEYSKKWNEYANQRAEKSVEVIEFQKKAYSSYVAWERATEGERLKYYGQVVNGRYAVDADTWDKQAYYAQLTGQKTQETHKATLEMMIYDYENTFVGGWKSGLLETQKEEQTWGKAMNRTAISTYENMAKGFSDILYDGITGDLKNLEEYFKSFGKSVLRTFTDEVGKKISQNVIKIAMEANWTGASQSALGIVDKLLGLAGVTSNLADMLSSGTIADNGALTSAALLARESVDSSILGFAKGGTPPVGKPVWVGEEGPELLFLGSPGYVMPSRESMAYAEMNGGYIPGYAYGGNVGNITRLMQTNMATNPAYYLAWDKSGRQYDIANIANIAASTRTITGYDESGTVLEYLTPAAAAALARSISKYNGTVEQQAGAGISGGGGFGGFMNSLQESVAGAIGGAANSMQSVLTPQFWQTAITMAGTSILASSAYELLGGSAFLDKLGIKALVNLTTSSGHDTMGGGGLSSSGLSWGISGISADGDYSSLGDLGGIIGRHTIPRAKNGIDYIPRDNFLVRADEGEKILTKQKAKEYREAERGTDGAALPPVQVNFVLDGKVLSKAIYSQTKSGVKVVHERGITNV